MIISVSGFSVSTIDLILIDGELQVGGVGWSGHSHHQSSVVISNSIKYVYWQINYTIYIIKTQNKKCKFKKKNHNYHDN